MSRLGIGALAITLLIACARTSEAPAFVPGSCDDTPMVSGVCVGVQGGPICVEDACTEGAVCDRIVSAADDASLQALAGSPPGTCITIAPGSYGPIAVAGGVSLLGRAAASVKLSSVQVQSYAGRSTLLRGLRLQSLAVQGGGGVKLDRVLVDGASGVGVATTEADLTLVQSTVAHTASVGVHVDCRYGCESRRPMLSLERTWFHDTRKAAVLALAVDARADHVVIERAAAEMFLFGRGIEVSGATLRASSLRIAGCDEAAIVLEGSSALLGPELAIDHTVRGIWLSAIPDGGVVLDGFTITDTAASGLTFGAGSKGIVVRNGSIGATRTMTIPADLGGTRTIGDGISWEAGAHAVVESSVRIEASERIPALIDATAVGAFRATLAGGDDEKGVFVAHGSAHPDLAIGEGIKVSYGEP